MSIFALRPLAFFSLIAIAIPLASVTARAAPILGVTATTDMGTVSGTIAGISNQSGLSTPVSANSSHAAPNGPNVWAGRQVSGDIYFQLPSTQLVDGFTVWNFNGANRDSVQDLTVESSLTGAADSYVAVPGSPSVFAEGVFNASEYGQTFTFPVPVTAQFFDFAVSSNYGGQVTGLSEVLFDSAPSGTPDAPELDVSSPGLALAISLGCLALLFDRRSSSSS